MCFIQPLLTFQFLLSYLQHISYMDTYSNVNILYLCDPHSPSIQTALSLIHKEQKKPTVFSHESELIAHAHQIDLLVIATPNYLHTPQLIRWGQFEHPCILIEKPVAINKAQLEAIIEAKRTHQIRTDKIWVAMEYRYIPAVQKLVQLVPDICGPIKCITIRENRFPFLKKVGELKTNDFLPIYLILFILKSFPCRLKGNGTKMVPKLEIHWSRNAVTFLICFV